MNEKFAVGQLVRYKKGFAIENNLATWCKVADRNRTLFRVIEIQYYHMHITLVSDDEEVSNLLNPFRRDDHPFVSMNNFEAASMSQEEAQMFRKQNDITDSDYLDMLLATNSSINKEAN